MTQPTPDHPARGPHSPRTEEEHAAVRRRALPVAAVALVLAAVSVIMPFTIAVTAFTPPNIFAVNLAFCAIMMGAGILFYARPTPGTGLARALCFAAILLGIGGSLMFTRQSVTSRNARETLEREHVQSIAKAAAAYAGKPDGQYPPDLLTILESEALDPLTLQSPYGRRDPFFNDFATLRQKASRTDFLKSVDTASDYLYVGGDLKAVTPTVASKIIVVASKTVILRVSISLAFADGASRYITREEVSEVLKACNDARKSIGLPEMSEVAAIKNAIDDAAANSPKKP